ncbi:extracellular solute-binding protein [Paenibacillus radicis (ex Xue et al. 2023)]|uniref:Extracellular solute-binding protein n=1 Tax=Paenibacillus radicis (ex Xue et al. 2023) TaxID=2972489 RepID=A0ABT1YIS4_9BACL|nr:extracellular solute-binding protein [Paenibacillus radicis (ex Xue et al. 2023)]MCR8633093.1 extracellular solute-binding protein [Paenibacillus radicis (ex Xue et al. 2023)]
MNLKSRMAMGCAAFVTVASLAACGGGSLAQQTKVSVKDSSSPMRLSIALPQVGDIPDKGNEIEQLIENYTHTKLDFQWIPNAAYTDKINVIIASNEMPKLLRAENTPAIVGAIQTGLFWELGPFLKDYKNLSAQNAQYYDNVSVNRKIYGIPNFREMGRAAFIYRKDWMDNLGLQQPKTIDEWYEVLKALTLNDPDRNGKNDTFGMVLYKKYNEGQASLATRFAVSLGAPNKWSIENGSFVPEFMSKEYGEMLKLFRRLYSEKLINQDFAVFDQSEAEKLYDSGRVGIRVAVAQNAKSQQDRLSKTDPRSIVEVEPMRGAQGIRVAGETGNNGFYVIPKSSVKTEEELRKVLTFLDQMMDPPMATLLLRGVENKHFVKTGDKTEYINFTAFQREVKPYRDNLPQIEGYNVAELKDTSLGEKSQKIAVDNFRYLVPNPALNLLSQTYSEQGKNLEQIIWDAQTKYIMGKIDEVGWKAEIDKWMQAGGSKVMQEYKADYEKTKNK